MWSFGAANLNVSSVSFSGWKECFMNESATYGYARVSSRDQNLSRQLDAFSKLGLLPERVFCDRASEKDFERPQYR